MSIGQLAERFGLAPHVLRHWEAVGLLTPVDRVGGRRRFSRDQIARVAMIVRGKLAGLSLDQLREVLSAPTPEQRRELLHRHHGELERRIAQAEASKQLIEHALQCSAADFTQCPGFQHLVEMMSGQVPLEIRPVAERMDQALAPPGPVSEGPRRRSPDVPVRAG